MMTRGFNHAQACLWARARRHVQWIELLGFCCWLAESIWRDARMLGCYWFGSGRRKRMQFIRRLSTRASSHGIYVTIILARPGQLGCACHNGLQIRFRTAGAKLATTRCRLRSCVLTRSWELFCAIHDPLHLCLRLCRRKFTPRFLISVRARVVLSGSRDLGSTLHCPVDVGNDSRGAHPASKRFCVLVHSICSRARNLYIKGSVSRENTSLQFAKSCR